MKHDDRVNNCSSGLQPFSSPVRGAGTNHSSMSDLCEVHLDLLFANLDSILEIFVPRNHKSSCECTRSRNLEVDGRGLLVLLAPRRDPALYSFTSRTVWWVAIESENGKQFADITCLL